MKLTCLILTLLLPSILGITLQEDDLVFDDITEETSPQPIVQPHKTKKYKKIERFWGIPDDIAVVGQVFKLKIPKQAFSGHIDHYEIRGNNGKELPHWLVFDEAASTIFGVPTKKDEGKHRIHAQAYGKHGASAEDNFVIKVVNENLREIKNKNSQKRCDESEEQTVMNILLDSRFDHLKTIVKVEAMENLAGFLGLHVNDLFMYPVSNKEENARDESTIVLTGPGNVKHRKDKHSTVIQWQVGCDGRIGKHHAKILKQIHEQARDGTLSEVLQLPVLLWRVKTDASDLLRNRRETGSGDYTDNDDEYDEDNYDDNYGSYDDGDNIDDNESITEIPPRAIVPVASEPKGFVTENEHPHRHHHGQETVDFETEERVKFDDIIRASNPQENAINTTTSSSPRLITESTEASTSEKPVTPVILTSSTEPETLTTESTTSIPSTTTTTTTMKPTTEELTTTSTTSTTTPSTTTSTTTTTTELPKTTTTDTFISGIRNLAPTVHYRLEKIRVTAGKVLSFIIPSNTFSDSEDGDTRNLKLKFLHEGKEINKTHWLQFNERTQEVYALPVEADVSQYEYDVIASDREGLNVSDRLDIYVQQHKYSKSFNHEFSIYLEILEHSAFPTNVDWKLRVVQRLAQLYGDTNSNHITVRRIDIINDSQAIFTWTNDSVPRGNECPKDEINKLLHVLIADKDDNPSAMLQQVLSPEIRVTRVVFRGIGHCEEVNPPEPPQPPEPEKPKKNYPPVPRNQVDRLDAVVGQLLTYRVPEDTFWDPEDGSTRNLRMSLLKIDRSAISPDDWLQFDSKNQEFYGVPLQEDFVKNNRRQYQLIVVDKEGAEAVDTLVVVIKEAKEMRHLVDFSMNLHIPYEPFAHSAALKRNLIEKLSNLFGDKDTSAISLSGITPIKEGLTGINWRNITLPTDFCPDAEIKRQMEILVKPEPEKSVTDHVHEVMGKEFPVESVTLNPLNICVGELTGVHTPGSFVPPTKESQDDYLITYILPAIIIAAMILLAGIIAFILYRRRRSGKMSVSQHDDERQSFRSKGIPVIFQDELEEKPDPGNKSPVILKEEKPPLPPPEYQKSDDGADQPMLPKENSEEPYQPPPPFARTSDNNRQNRPKPTPTYRKPPPYVPP